MVLAFVAGQSALGAPTMLRYFFSSENRRERATTQVLDSLSTEWVVYGSHPHVCDCMNVWQELAMST